MTQQVYYISKNRGLTRECPLRTRGSPRLQVLKTEDMVRQLNNVIYGRSLVGRAERKLVLWT